MAKKCEHQTELQCWVTGKTPWISFTSSKEEAAHSSIPDEKPLYIQIMDLILRSLYNPAFSYMVYNVLLSSWEVFALLVFNY